MLTSSVVITISIQASVSVQSAILDVLIAIFQGQKPFKDI